MAQEGSEDPWCQLPGQRYDNPLKMGLVRPQCSDCRITLDLEGPIHSLFPDES